MSVMDRSDAFFMDHALSLARQGLYTTRPNPAVGAVFVKEGKILGEGSHHYAGSPHAEIVAIHDAAARGFDLAGSTCYVTLEPCCHHGRTPPCVEALIRLGVKRVVMAIEDPNPAVQGGGRKALEAQGIEVISGVGEQEAAQINQGFFYAMKHGRPFVRAKVAMSLDGRTAMASGESQWITSLESRQDVQKLRARSGAIITGVQTVIDDNPCLTVRPESWALRPPYEIPPPLRVVCDSNLRARAQAKVFEGSGKKWIACATPHRHQHDIFQALDVEVVCLPNSQTQQVDLSQLLHQLHRAEIRDVLIEAGPNLTGAFLKEGLIHELWVYIAPQFLGHEARPMLNLSGIQTLSQAILMEIISVRHLGKDLCIVVKNSM